MMLLLLPLLLLPLMVLLLLLLLLLQALEIKRLNAAIAGLRSELNKQEEALEDCRSYKEFLDSVTPNEWFAAQAARQEVRGNWAG
jgi:predicted Holliday junction resolvase-like endonuclease